MRFEGGWRCRNYAGQALQMTDWPRGKKATRSFAADWERLDWEHVYVYAFIPPEGNGQLNIAQTLR